MAAIAQLESFLNRRLLGQQEAVGEFCSALIRAQRGPGRPSRTKAFLLLLGPTGTGKTEMVQLAAQHLYGDRWTSRLERFDMGEYQHPDSVKRLLGSPDQPPLLGQAIGRLNARGGGILLLDEIEKAFPDLLTALLSFDSARSTMFDGATCDLSQLVVVLTSNLGAAEAARMENSGYSAIRRKLWHAAEERFRKEGVARFNAVICLNVLGFAVQEQITRLLLHQELALQSRHLRRHLEAGPEVVTFLIGKGFSPDLGARNIRNTVERMVGEALESQLVRLEGRPETKRQATDRWTDALVLVVAGDRLSAVPVPRSEALTRLLEKSTERAIPPPRSGVSTVRPPDCETAARN